MSVINLQVLLSRVFGLLQQLSFDVNSQMGVRAYIVMQQLKSFVTTYNRLNCRNCSFRFGVFVADYSSHGAASLTSYRDIMLLQRITSNPT